MVLHKTCLVKMDGASSQKLSFIVAIKRGKGFDSIKSSLYIKGCLNRFILQTKSVQHSPDPQFNFELVWRAPEIFFKNLGNTFVKIHCYAISKDEHYRVGYLLIGIGRYYKHQSDVEEEIWCNLLDVRKTNKYHSPQILIGVKCQNTSPRPHLISLNDSTSLTDTIEMKRFLSDCLHENVLLAMGEHLFDYIITIKIKKTGHLSTLLRTGGLKRAKMYKFCCIGFDQTVTTHTYSDISKIDKLSASDPVTLYVPVLDEDLQKHLAEGTTFVIMLLADDSEIGYTEIDIRSIIDEIEIADTIEKHCIFHSSNEICPADVERSPKPFADLVFSIIREDNLLHEVHSYELYVTIEKMNFLVTPIETIFTMKLHHPIYDDVTSDNVKVAEQDGSIMLYYYETLFKIQLSGYPEEVVKLIADYSFGLSVWEGSLKVAEGRGQWIGPSLDDLKDYVSDVVLRCPCTNDLMGTVTLRMVSEDNGPQANQDQVIEVLTTPLVAGARIVCVPIDHECPRSMSARKGSCGCDLSPVPEEDVPVDEEALREMDSASSKIMEIEREFNGKFSQLKQEVHQLRAKEEKLHQENTALRGWLRNDDDDAEDGEDEVMDDETAMLRQQLDSAKEELERAQEADEYFKTMAEKAAEELRLLKEAKKTNELWLVHAKESILQARKVILEGETQEKVQNYLNSLEL